MEQTFREPGSTLRESNRIPRLVLHQQPHQLLAPRELFVSLHRFTHPRHTVRNLMCYFAPLRTIPSRCLLHQLAQIADVAIALSFPYPASATTRNPKGPPRWSSRATMSSRLVDAEHLTLHLMFDPRYRNNPSRISVNELQSSVNRM
jgi:hypothetical protein